MSSTSPRAAAKKIECPQHEGSVFMEPAIVDITFPRGKLPVHGFRCPQCGEELIQGGTLAQAQALARSLGMAGVELSTVRKAMPIGSSIGATIPRPYLERLGIEAGTPLTFELHGDHIEMRARGPGAHSSKSRKARKRVAAKGKSSTKSPRKH